MTNSTPAARPQAASAGAARATRAPRTLSLGLLAALVPTASCGGDAPPAETRSEARAEAASTGPPSAELLEPAALLAPLGEDGDGSARRSAFPARGRARAASRLGLRFERDRYADLHPRRRPSVRAALDWLAREQESDGRWDCDWSEEAAPGDPSAESTHDPGHDVGVTSLALLAYLGDGHSATRGTYRRTVRRAARWLVEQQDEETGLVTHGESYSFMYDHAVATLALCELVEIDGVASVREAATRAVRYAEAARNPGRGWRYASPPNGQTDTSITAWMATALDAARRAGIEVDAAAFADTLTWFDDMSDDLGRVGYRRAGETSSRVEGRNDQYPTDGGEALTACALFTSALLGETVETRPRMRQHADLLLQARPKWSHDGMTNDMYYWYYAAQAMHQVGGLGELHLRNAIDDAVLPNQRLSGPVAGSWDPDGPWGFSGGRVYSTALMVMALEAPFRYTRTKSD